MFGVSVLQDLVSYMGPIAMQVLHVRITRGALINKLLEPWSLDFLQHLVKHITPLVSGPLTSHYNKHLLKPSLGMTSLVPLF